MKTYKLYKELAIAYWEALNDNDLTEAEKKKDAQVLMKYFDYFMTFVYSAFVIFSLISLYFFTTRVIF